MIKEPNKDCYQKVYQFLSSMNKAAYKDVYLLSSQVLIKNPFTNNFLARYQKKEKIEKPGSFLIIKKLSKYYFYSFKTFLKFLLGFIEFALLESRYSFPKNKNQLILIDMPFLISNIKKEEGFTDTYFPGLVSFLTKLNLNYAYLPVFVGMRKHFTLSNIFKSLKEKDIPFIAEYQLLSAWDLLRVLCFIIVYPFNVFSFRSSLNTKIYEQNLLSSELIETLDDVTFINYARYLFGRQISKLPYKKIKVISWDENQVINKNFYKGLKKDANKVKVYGAQLLIYSKNVLNIITDENEVDFGTVPDKIVVNGPWYIPKETKLNYSIGPSLRFSEIFSLDLNNLEKINILVLLPYYKEEIEYILQILNNIKEWPDPLLIKPHPVIDINAFRGFLPPNAKIVNGNLYKLFKKTKIMISGGASGTLIEATTLGIPTVFLKDPDKFDGNPLPQYGKGIIWEEATNSYELKEKIKNLRESLRNNKDEIINISQHYKENFFCQPTEANILNAFDLNPI